MDWNKQIYFFGTYKQTDVKQVLCQIFKKRIGPISSTHFLSLGRNKDGRNKKYDANVMMCATLVAKNYDIVLCVFFVGRNLFMTHALC